jgi:hypothetical protein
VRTEQRTFGTHDLPLSDPLKFVLVERTKLVTVKGTSQDRKEIPASAYALSLRVSQRNRRLIYKVGSVLFEVGTEPFHATSMAVSPVTIRSIYNYTKLWDQRQRSRQNTLGGM